jgi:hypothetical protein
MQTETLGKHEALSEPHLGRTEAALHTRPQAAHIGRDAVEAARADLDQQRHMHRKDHHVPARTYDAGSRRLGERIILELGALQEFRLPRNVDVVCTPPA